MVVELPIYRQFILKNPDEELLNFCSKKTGLEFHGMGMYCATAYTSQEAIRKAEKATGIKENWTIWKQWPIKK